MNCPNCDSRSVQELSSNGPQLLLMCNDCSHRWDYEVPKCARHSWSDMPGTRTYAGVAARQVCDVCQRHRVNPAHP